MIAREISPMRKNATFKAATRGSSVCWELDCRQTMEVDVEMYHAEGSSGSGWPTVCISRRIRASSPERCLRGADQFTPMRFLTYVEEDG